MVGRLGFEPRTNGLKVRCSTVELTARGQWDVRDPSYIVKQIVYESIDLVQDFYTLESVDESSQDFKGRVS